MTTTHPSKMKSNSKTTIKSSKSSKAKPTPPTTFDSHIQTLNTIDFTNTDAVADAKAAIQRDMANMTNRDVHTLITGVISHRSDQASQMNFNSQNQKLQLNFILGLNLHTRGAIRTYVLVLRSLFELTLDNKSILNLFSVVTAHVPQIIAYYKKRIVMNSNISASNPNSQNKKKPVIDEDLTHLLIDLAYKLFTLKSEYESYSILELVSELIVLNTVFPVKSYTLKYFAMLFNIFISRGQLYMSANIIYRILLIDKKTNLTREYVRDLIKLMNVKDKEEEYHKLMGGLMLVNQDRICADLRINLTESENDQERSDSYNQNSFNNFNSQSSSSNFLFDQETEFNLKSSDLQNFAYLTTAKGKSFNMSQEFRNYVSFMALNNFEYFIDKNTFFFNGNYKKVSNSVKIFDIVNKMRDRSTTDTRKDEEKRINEIRRSNLRKAAKYEKKTETEKDTQVDKTSTESDEPQQDFFTDKFNLFRMFNMCHSDISSKEPTFLQERQNEINQRQEREMEKKLRSREKYEQRKNEIEKLIAENTDNRRTSSVSVRSESSRVETRPDPARSESSWRFASKEVLLSDVSSRNQNEEQKGEQNDRKPERNYVPPRSSHSSGFNFGKSNISTEMNSNSSNYMPPQSQRSNSYDPSRTFGKLRINETPKTLLKPDIKSDTQKNKDENTYQFKPSDSSYKFNQTESTYKFNKPSSDTYKFKNYEKPSDSTYKFKTFEKPSDSTYKFKNYEKSAESSTYQFKNNEKSSDASYKFKSSEKPSDSAYQFKSSESSYKFKNYEKPSNSSAYKFQSSDSSAYKFESSDFNYKPSDSSSSFYKPPGRKDFNQKNSKNEYNRSDKFKSSENERGNNFKENRPAEYKKNDLNQTVKGDKQDEKKKTKFTANPFGKR